MIDAHCHLQDIPEEKWVNSGLEAMICAGYSLESSKKAIEIAASHKDVYSTVGVHPEEKEDFNHEELLKLCKHKKVVAVGECGIDGKENLEKQIELFKLNINLAKETGLPLVVHCRNAFEEIFSNLDYDKVQMHCFTGNKEQMDECIKRGWYISFGGILTFKKSDGLREVANLVPGDRILVETDSPYLAPEPVRGTANIPANVKIVADLLTKLRGTSINQISVTNTKILFSKII